MIFLKHVLILATILFILGFICLLSRRNLFFILIGLEIMINSISLIFVTAGNYWDQSDGQIMYILTISLSAVEIGIGLALALQLYDQYQTLEIYKISEIKE